MMDAAEIARLRCAKPRREAIAGLCWGDLDTLLDASEQARKENGRLCVALTGYIQALEMSRKIGFDAIAQRDAAQQDAKDARALLHEIAGGPSAWRVESSTLRARIEAMLEKKL